MNPRWDQDERFADWVDGRLPAAERERLQRDLEADPELRQRLEDYRATVDWLRTAEDDERAPEGLVDAVMARVDAEGGASGPVLGGPVLAGPGAPRRWLPAVSSFAAAAAVVAIAVFLWNVDGGLTREDAARLGPEDVAPALELTDTDLSEGDVRFAEPEETPSDVAGVPSKSGKSGRPGKAGNVGKSDGSGEATRQQRWGELGRAQQGVDEGRPVQAPRQVFHVAQGQVDTGQVADRRQPPPVSVATAVTAEPTTAGDPTPPAPGRGRSNKQGPDRQLAEAEREQQLRYEDTSKLESGEELMRKVEKLAKRADDDPGSVEKAKKGEQLQLLQYARPSAEGEKAPAQRDQVVDMLNERLLSLGSGGGRKTEERAADQKLGVGSLVVLVTVAEPANLPSAEPVPETKVRMRQRGAQRRAEVESGGELDQALSLVEPETSFYSNRLPPTVFELPPVLLRRDDQNKDREAMASKEAGPFALATGDRVFAVTGEPTQLGTYFSQLKEIVNLQQGHIDLVRTRPGEDFGILGGVEQFVQAQTPVLGFVGQDELLTKPGDTVLVVVRSSDVPAAAGAEAEAKTEAKKR